MRFFQWRAAKKRITQLGTIRTAEGEEIGICILTTNIRRDRRLPDLVYLTISYRGRPLPNREEFETFDRIQDGLDSLHSEPYFEQVAIMTIDGKRDYILYAEDGSALVNRLWDEFADVQPRHECVHDPNWTQYRDLLKM